jgi:Fe-coproporphyrin III synthase
MRPPSRSAHRVLQIHPTRRCNLRCLHCYSESSPGKHAELDVDVLTACIADAAAQGYNILGMSGGEPLMYGPLPELLLQARACGMRTTVTSNGMLLDERRLEVIGNLVDLLAISLDGRPESHNAMRASSRAFETMAARLDGLRRSAIPFGFIFTLTQFNLHELGWVADFALQQGARLLQVHPLELAGRARTTLSDARPDAVEAGYAYREVARIQASVGARLYVQLDLTPRQTLPPFVGDFSTNGPPVDDASPCLADLVSPLVVEPDGAVVPIQYGFSRSYALGNIQNAPLIALADSWKRERYADFRNLCAQLHRDITGPDAPPFVNWYDGLWNASRSPMAV